LLATGVDCGVGVLDGFAKGGGGAFLSVFNVNMRDIVDGNLAGQLANGMGAHAIGNDKKVPALRPLPGIVGGQNGMAILIVAAAHSYVGQTCVFDRKVARHQSLPRSPCLRTLSMLPSPGALA
jgi:hypothetical protein